MALELQDLMALQSMDKKSELTPYEQYKVGFMQAKKPSGVAIAGLTVGVAGAVAAIGSWIFNPLYSNAKANQAKETALSAKDLAAAQYTAALQLMNQQNQDTKANIDRILLGLQRETDARTAGDLNITTTINDTLSGQQSSSLTAQQAAELAASQATQQVMQQTFADAVTGRSSLNATPVQIYSAPQPCSCPGCGCNG
jgi:hypothetical protein